MELHNFLGLTWIVLFVFIVFWVVTTGEWLQYIPTTKKLFEVIGYYASGIFKGLPHPVKKSREAKHNPLQRLTYLGLTAVLLTLQMATGLLYYLYNDWAIWGWTFLDLRFLALIHLGCAFAILSFVIIHVYMTTTGHQGNRMKIFFPANVYPAQHGIRLFSSNEPKRHRFTQRNQNYAFHAGRGLACYKREQKRFEIATC